MEDKPPGFRTFKIDALFPFGEFFLYFIYITNVLPGGIIFWLVCLVLMFLMVILILYFLHQ